MEPIKAEMSTEGLKCQPARNVGLKKGNLVTLLLLYEKVHQFLIVLQLYCTACCSNAVYRYYLEGREARTEVFVAECFRLGAITS